MAATAPQEEVTIIGQVLGASDLGVPSASCTWRLETGAEWRHTTGTRTGRDVPLSVARVPAISIDCARAHPLSAADRGTVDRGHRACTPSAHTRCSQCYNLDAALSSHPRVHEPHASRSRT